jgi:hypothetical protein
MATVADFKLLLRRLLGAGAYAQDDDSVVSRELEILATGLADASANLLALREEFFLETLDVFLPRVESMLGLPTDPALTREQRRDRIIAHVNTHGARPADLRASVARLITTKNPDHVAIVERVLTDQTVVNVPENIFQFFVHVDPTVALPDDEAAINRLIDQQAHAHTQGQFIQSRAFRTNDPFSLTNRDILGG